jgi:diguanylate cyclase (GGDEF)-like protein
MQRLQDHLRWLLVRDTPPDIALEQLGEIARHVPTIVALLLLNIVCVAALHYGTAPPAMTVGLGGIFALLCLARLFGTKFASLGDTEDVDRARQLLRRMVLAAGIVAALYVAWVTALTRYGLRDLDLLFILTPLAGAILCLMRLPQAVVVLAPQLLVPFLCFRGITDKGTLAVTLVEIALTLGIVTRVLRHGSVTFDALIRSRTAISIESCAAERLACENARMAHVDPLTGLPNRLYFFAELDRIVAARTATGEGFALGLLDLDRFKPVNDTYGHAAGDRLLAMLGQRMADAIDDDVIVARLGGDEFGVLLLSGDDDHAAIGAALCDLVAMPFRLDDGQLLIGATCGLAIFPEAGSSARELYDHCDYALYHGKATHRGRCTIFSAEHELNIRAGQVMEAALQTADLDRELDLHFQPVVDIASGRIVSVEALARWESPVLGHVPPDQFIRLAEGMGIIGTMTRVLFRKALAHVAALPADIDMAFNLSAMDIVSPETMRALLAMLDASGIDPARIIFEITETAVIRDFDVAVAAIIPLRARGVRIALDDFGTGFSSLTHLRRLPLDRVKVDRSFAADLSDTGGQQVVDGIAVLCRKLGLDCVIEGIETVEQLLRVRACGYRWGQGHLFGRAMSIGDLSALLDPAEPTLRAIA